MLCLSQFLKLMLLFQVQSSLQNLTKCLIGKKEKYKIQYENPITYDPHKVLDKVNNHKKPITPDLGKMTTRPIDDGPLPSYMKNIFNKQAGLMQTANSLKMNNYSDGKFSNTASSFWPKKSFNKIIQLNIMNSLKFKEKLGFKDEENSSRYN